MKKENKFIHFVNMNIVVNILVFLLIFFNRYIINNISFSLFMAIFMLVITFFIEYKNKVYKIPFLFHNLYTFIFKTSVTILLFIVFYFIFILKNRLDVESILLLIFAFFPLLLKSLISLSFYIKFYFLKKKYNIKDLSIIPKILNLKKLVVTKNEMYKDKFKIHSIFASNKNTKVLDHYLKNAIQVFNKTLFDQKMIKSFKLEEDKKESVKITSNQVCFKDKNYIKGNVPSLLSKCKYFIKNNRKYKLNKSAYKHILDCYYKVYHDCSNTIGYAYKKKEEEDFVFIGFIGCSYIYKEGFHDLEKQISVVQKKTSSYDRRIKDINSNISLNKNDTFKNLANLIFEVKEFNYHLKIAILSYLANKVILAILVLFSFYLSISLVTIPSLFFLEGIMSSILFFEFSFFPHKNMKMNSFLYFGSILLKALLNLCICGFLYPYLDIDLLRCILFFSFFLQQIFSIYPFIFDRQMIKDSYLNAFLLLFLFLFLLLYKTDFLRLSFFSFSFVFFMNLSLFLFIEIIKNIKQKNS